MADTKPIRSGHDYDATLDRIDELIPRRGKNCSDTAVCSKPEDGPGKSVVKSFK